MRSTLIYCCFIVFTALATSGAEPENTNAAPEHVISLSLPVWKNADELKRWAVSDPEILAADIVSVEKNGNRVMVIPKVTGSGIWRVTFYVYGYDRSTRRWRPLGVFFTATRSIKVETIEASSEMVVRSRAGKKLLTIPLAPYLFDSMPAKGED
jgi:hypothetical protein